MTHQSALVVDTPKIALRQCILSAGPCPSASWLVSGWTSWPPGHKLFHFSALHHHLLGVRMSQYLSQKAADHCQGMRQGLMCRFYLADGPVQCRRTWIPWWILEGWKDCPAPLWSSKASTLQHMVSGSWWTLIARCLWLHHTQESSVSLSWTMHKYTMEKKY